MAAARSRSFRLPLRSFHLRAALLASAALSLAACEDAGDSGLISTRGSTTGTECSASLCDIREPSCQQAIVRTLRCIRGGETLMPPVDVISEDEYLDDLRSGAGASDPASDEAYASFSRGLSLLRLSPPDQTAEDDQSAFVSQIAAVYLPDEQRIVVIDRGAPLDDHDAVATMAHEMVHAMQDVEHGLNGLLDSTTGSLDAVLALKAVVEGEAVLYQLLFGAVLDGASFDRIDWDRTYGAWQADSYREAYDDEAPIVMSFVRFPYAFGADYVSRAWADGGNASVRALYSPLPETSYEVLLGQAQPSRRDDARTLLDEAGLDLVEDHELIALDELGAWIQNVFLHRNGLSDTEQLDAAQLDRISADAFTVYANVDTGDVVSAWRLAYRDGAAPTSSTLGDWRSAFGAAPIDPPAPGATARVWSPDDDLALVVAESALSASLLSAEPQWLAINGGAPADGMASAALRHAARYAPHGYAPHGCAQHVRAVLTR